MPLFPQEQKPTKSGPDASQRMFWTREGGTRRLVIGFLGLIVIWIGVDKIRDHYLLEHHWKALAADLTGLTVVGTLDARGDYDRNMFRVVQANKEFRVELTDFGWRSIFDPKNGPMFTEATGNAIKHARDVDGDTGSAMLEPYLRSGIAHLLGQTDWLGKVDENAPVVVEGSHPGAPVNKGNLGALIAKYSAAGGMEGGVKETQDGGGTGSTHEVEHGMTIPADTLARVCPIALTGPQFNSATLEEQQSTLVGGKTWILHLGLTAEGRSRFYQWSHNHINENLVFVLNHEVLAAGRVPAVLDVDDWGLGPLHDEEAARKLEAYVRGRSSPTPRR